LVVPIHSAKVKQISKIYKSYYIGNLFAKYFSGFFETAMVDWSNLTTIWPGAERMFDKIAKKKRSHIAAEMLIDAIRKQKLSPGDKLPPERVIASEMGLSRNTIREAISALQIMWGSWKRGTAREILSLTASTEATMTRSFR